MVGKVASVIILGSSKFEIDINNKGLFVIRDMESRMPVIFHKNIHDHISCVLYNCIHVNINSYTNSCKCKLSVITPNNVNTPSH